MGMDEVNQINRAKMDRAWFRNRIYPSRIVPAMEGRGPHKQRNKIPILSEFRAEQRFSLRSHVGRFD